MSDPEANLERGPSPAAALAAWFLLLVAVVLPWWRVTYKDGSGFVYADDGYRLFAPAAPETTAWAPHLTGAVVAVVLLWLFVRIAANSREHEPHRWHRDLVLLAGISGFAVLSALLWPGDLPSFWGGRTFSDANATLSFSEAARPGLGWWSALLAVLLLGWAAWASRATTPK